MATLGTFFTDLYDPRKVCRSASSTTYPRSLLNFHLCKLPLRVWGPSSTIMEVWLIWIFGNVLQLWISSVPSTFCYHISHQFTTTLLYSYNISRSMFIASVLSKIPSRAFLSLQDISLWFSYAHPIHHHYLQLSFFIIMQIFAPLWLSQPICAYWSFFLFIALAGSNG